MSGKNSPKFKFHRNDSIGANAAENDAKFLETCFVDTGDIQQLLDTSNPRSLLVGRTGSGKSAGLLHLQTHSPDNSVRFDPEQLSLNYIANSDILSCLLELDVNLDPFFKLLWRHLFAVTIFQERCDVTTEEKQKTFLSRLGEQFESSHARQARQHELRRRQKVVDYLNEFGGRFFIDVEDRVQEIVDKFSDKVVDDLQTNAGISVKGPKAAPFSVDVGEKQKSLTELAKSTEVRRKIESRAKAIVNKLHVRQLTGILSLLDEILDDPQKPFYLCVDKLDEDWVDPRIRSQLIKALIDNASEFSEVANAKVIVAMRSDLLQKIFREFRTETGFQEDKYLSLRAIIDWSEEELVEVAERRLAALVEFKFSKKTKVTLKDFFPSKINVAGIARPIREYLLERTWMRPRDVIDFINSCISKADGKGRLTQQNVINAEREYSRNRLRALTQEWHGFYPDLEDLVKKTLVRRPARFGIEAITTSDVETHLIAVLCSVENEQSLLERGRLGQISFKFQEGLVTLEKARAEIVATLFHVGIVGVKRGKGEGFSWSGATSGELTPADVLSDVMLEIHPGLYSVLKTTL